jgi:hypothetical protein
MKSIEEEDEMAEVLILEFESPEAAELYQSVNRVLGVDATAGTGDWPAPLVMHLAGSSEGKLLVAEIWESKEAHEQFMERLGAAFQELNVPPPSRMEWFDLAGSYHRH